jgi:cold shock CspA family protein
MTDKRCSISVVVNGQRWLEEGDALAELPGMPRRWSLCGLQDFVRISVGAKLGYTFENTDFVEQRWCRAKANAGDAEAISAGFTVATTPHITTSDPGAGLSLEAVEIAATSDTHVVVTVGSHMQWLPLRQKLEARSSELFELLLPATGKVVVSTDRVIDIRELARQHFADDPAKALFRAPPVVAGDPDAAAEAPTADVSLAANAARGTVKSLAKGYGIITRKDGLGDVQFLAAHVQAPGFEFVEVGDDMRFDVVQASSGKWVAQRVVRG